MHHAWSEITISKYLYHEVEGNLSDFEDHIHHDLQKVLFQNIPETVTISNDLKDRIEFTKKPLDNGDMLYRADLYFS